MTLSTWKTLMYLLMAVGAALLLTAAGLYLFTDLATEHGVAGVYTIVLVAGAGLLLLLPSKLFLTLLLMQTEHKSEH